MRTHGAYRRRERARRQTQAEWEALALGLAAAAWWCRVELALLGGIVVVHVVLAQRLGGPVAAAGVVGAVGVLLAVRPVRQRITTVLHGARVRRAWDRTVLDAGASTGPFRGLARSVKRPGRTSAAAGLALLAGLSVIAVASH